jgi:peptide chain release factor 1
MFNQLDSTEEKYDEIGEKLGQPAVLADQELFLRLMREHKALAPLVGKYREYKAACRSEREAREIIDSKPERELREMADEELSQAREDIGRLTDELNILLLPRDKNDERNVIVEIRGGAGGEEAALFAASLFRMYSMYAEHRGWKTEVLNLNDTELGGIKEISFMIEGDGAYSRLKYESGVHRVQRVPETEASGRIHTSTVTVAVLPEAEDVELSINPDDLRIDTYRSSGAGGQHINKTDSAIRITYLPTGLVVECQDERSQYKNKDKAMKVLRSRLYEQMQNEQNDKIASERRSQVGTGDRSERIRTYNFPQGRVTDHRIGLTLYKIDSVLNGELDEIIDPLITADRAEKLKAGSGE